MLKAQTLAILYGQESIISSSITKSNAESKVKYLDKQSKSDTVFVLSASISDQESKLKDILSKSGVMGKVSIATLEELHVNYEKLDEPNLVYFYSLGEFDPKYNFKSFKKGSKTLTICPDLSSIMDDEVHKASLWKLVIRPLTL